MAKTWADISAELATLLGSGNVALYPADLKRLAFNMAQRYFAITHTAALSAVTATVAGGQVVFEGGAEPDNMLSPPASPILLQVDTGWLEPHSLVPGAPLWQDGYTYTSPGIRVWDANVTDVTVWYYAFYAEMTGDTSVYSGPSWALPALLVLSHVFLLDPAMMSQQNLRQFQGRREAGDPEDNPPRAQANFYFRMYHDMVNRIKPQDREILS